MNYPQVALDFMNHDHAEFVDLREQLLDQLIAPERHHEITATLEALLEHTRRHFGAEEALMQQMQFPPYPVHKGEHDRVLQGMIERVEHWRTTHDIKPLRNWLEQEVADWFLNHVRTMDFVTANFIAARQRHG